jgi:type I restriction enzyme M protein
MVSFKEIKENDWDLSINRYKEVVHEEVTFSSPAAIIKEIKSLDQDRAKALQTLEKLLK